jgi:FkbM family methyltransferase
VPATRHERFRVLARAWLPWRKLLGNRTVRREVQGVQLYMPWSHLLPDYARARASYGQNLVELAASLTRHDADPAAFRLLDIGANIGDSTLQVLRRTAGEALCVDADPYWLRYLHMNVDADPRITVAEAMLTPTDEGWGNVRAVRQTGTTRFVEATGEDGASARLSVGELRRRHPKFEAVRLIKSDTDGFDPVLVPAAAAAWQSSRPVLFFEFDPSLARRLSEEDPNRMWDELRALGYSRVAIWDNTGDPLGQLGIAEAATEAKRLDTLPAALSYQFWDVAACHENDRGAAAAFDELMPLPFDPRGHRRG